MLELQTMLSFYNPHRAAATGIHRSESGSYLTKTPNGDLFWWRESPCVSYQQFSKRLTLFALKIHHHVTHCKTIFQKNKQSGMHCRDRSTIKYSVKVAQGITTICDFLRYLTQTWPEIDIELIFILISSFLSKV